MTQTRSYRSWAVIGGGFLGMTVALRLAQEGNAVTLFEAAPYLGGVASAWKLGDIIWDRHYHVVLQSDTRLRALLKEIGLDGELEWKKARTGFFVDSQLHSMSNALEFLVFPCLNLIEKFRLIATILRAAGIRDSRELEKISAEEWLEKWSGKSVTKKLWMPLLRSKLGDRCGKVSAAFIWASIARMYAARRTGAKTESFGYVPGGYARILKALEQLLIQSGVKIRLGQPVRAVRTSTPGELRVELGGASSENFSNAAVTAPAPVAAQLCVDLRDAEMAQLRGITYQGLICASLLLKKPLSPFYITNIADNRMPFTAVIEMSALVDRSQFGGRSLVYLPKYIAPDSPYFAAPDTRVREDFLSALERMHSGFRRKDVECFQISRVKHLLPLPIVNYSENIPPMCTSVPGLYLVNSAQIVNGTLNVNETVGLAETAVRQLAHAPAVHLPSPHDFSHELATAHS